MNALDLLQVYLQRASADNRDMQVQAPGQNQFPNQMFGLLLHPNAAGIYGRGERPPPAGDIVLPQAGYRDARSRNAYAPRPDENPVIRKYNELTLEPRTLGFQRIAMRGPPSAQPQQQAMPSPQDLALLAQRQQAWEAQQRQQISGLPEAVQRSLMEQPDYAEGGVIPGPRNPLMEQELGARAAPQRENDLDVNTRFMEHLKRFGEYAMPEGASPPRLGHEQQRMQPPFASPLNQFLQRAPFALY